MYRFRFEVKYVEGDNILHTTPGFACGRQESDARVALVRRWPKQKKIIQIKTIGKL